MYGGAALTATHALMQMLSAVLPGPDGLLPEPLRAGIVPPDRRRGRGLGRAAARQRGARLAGRASCRRRRRRGVLRPDDGGAVGHGQRLRERLAAAPEDRAPRRGLANLSIRLAPGQTTGGDGARARAPPPRGCARGGEPRCRALVDGRARLRRPGARRRFASRRTPSSTRSAHGRCSTRSGGTIPVVASLGARGIPAIVTGFARPTAQIHSPNEHIPANALRDGLAATVELLRRLAAIESPSRRAGSS